MTRAMADSSSPEIATLFRMLDRWRHLPAYRLEPRADSFFALYLREVVAAHVGEALHDVVIPELPLRRGTLWGETTQAPNKSTKVDYALAAKSGETFYLLELKTDVTSRRDEQDAYLERAGEIGLHGIVKGILGIVAASDAKYLQKYVHLLHDLARLGLVQIPTAVYAHAFPEVRTGITAALGNVRNLVAQPGPRIQVIYVQPEPDPEHDSIGFEEVAAVVERHGDPLSLAFAQSLRRWRAPAGAALPSEWGD
jgi:hypothetical protein